MIKFNKNIDEFQYCLSFDIAKHLTGWSLYDFKNNQILLSGIIDTSKSNKYIWVYYLEELQKIFHQCKDTIGVNNISSLFITKEQLPCQAGPASTISTLQALAQAHAIFNVAVELSKIEYYDFDGIHAASEKAYFKHLTGLEKPTKDDIKAKIAEMIPESKDKLISLDVSDSMAVTLTLLNWKWDRDIDEEIKAAKRESKKAKSEKKIAEIADYINKLKNLQKGV